MGCVITAAHSNKRQARLPTLHFKKLLEETCTNHTYPIRHNLKDCDMMKSFMILGSPARGTELGEVLGESDTTPFPRENAIMMVYDRCPC
jgi:hypothetical protein